MYKRKICRRLVEAAAVCAFLLFVGTALSESLWAQKRVFARVEPNKDATTDFLIFDVNVDPSDNISPNLVFSADSKRGFVAYAGSGTVMVFSTEDGEILHRIKTEGRPQFSMPLPDGRTLAVVSVLDNRIFLIDMESHSVFRTFIFAGAQFGFGSLLTLSPDGRFGYISSTGTGEIIKFDLADGRELGRLRGFQAPAQITVSHDGATLIVVDTLTEEVVFVDSAALTRKAAFKGPNATINFTIFNKPVLHPNGLTGIIASRDLNGILGIDTVFLFEVATAKILDSRDAGSEPGFTGLTPDGKFWVVYNEFSITIIPTNDFKAGREVQTVRGDPLGSANIVFSLDSRYMFYASSASDLVFQHDLQTDAVVGQVLVGDVPNFFLDQPAAMSMTPDGKVIAVLDFVSNNIELLTDVTVLHSTKFLSAEDRFTGLTLINLSDQPTTFTLFALNDFGEVIDLTDINNPAEFQLAPNEQISLTVAEIFKLDLSEPRQGRVIIFSSQPEVAGYVSLGDTDLGRLDGFPLFSDKLFEWIVPEVVKQEGATVELNFVNPNFNQAVYDLQLLSADGSERASQLGSVTFPTNRQPQNVRDLFVNFEDFTDGYIRLKSRQGILFTESIELGSATAALNGIELSRFNGVSAVYSPQFATIPGFRTILNLINAAGDEADVTIELRAADGSLIGQPITRTLAKGAQIKEDLATLFENEPAALNATGWLKITTTLDRAVGTVTFTNQDETFLTSFALSGDAMDKFLFPILAHDSVYQTGVAILNAEPDAADVTVEIWGPGGTKDRSTTFTLAAGNRVAVYLDSLFPGLDDRLIGNIRIHSTGALHAFSLINDREFNFITAIPPVPLP